MEEKEIREKLDELHGELETFPNPIRSISSRENNFRLESAGWGKFMIYAKVVLKDKTNIRLNHWLELFNEDGTRTKN